MNLKCVECIECKDLSWTPHHSLIFRNIQMHKKLLNKRTECYERKTNTKKNPNQIEKVNEQYEYHPEYKWDSFDHFINIVIMYNV